MISHNLQDFKIINKYTIENQKIIFFKKIKNKIQKFKKK